jgi:hypothetical protein
VVPIGFGLGGLDLEAARFMLFDPRYAAQKAYVRTPTPSTNLFRLLGEVGLIGLGLLTAIVFRWYLLFRNSDDLRGELFVVAAFVGLMFVGRNALAAYLFLCGAFLARARLMNGRLAVPGVL